MNASLLFPYQLYLVISEADCKGRNFLEVAEAAISGGVDIIQLREKNASEADFLKKAQQLKILTDHHRVPLIINDHAGVAEKVQAAGIHVGNSDAAPGWLRTQLHFADKLIGYSIESLSQLSNQHTEASDYLGVSPVFNTTTKKDTITEWRLEGISAIRERTSKPLVAIGGIHIANAKAVTKAGADCIAVVSAICGAPDPRLAAQQLRNEISHR